MTKRDRDRRIEELTAIVSEHTADRDEAALTASLDELEHELDDALADRPFVVKIAVAIADGITWLARRVAP